MRALSSPRAASACSSSTCSTISRTRGGTANRTSTPPARPFRGPRRSIWAGWWDLGTGKHRLSRHPPFQTPTSRPTGCANATSALREKYEVQTIGWPEAIRSFTLKVWGRGSGTPGSLPARGAQAGRRAETPEARAAPSFSLAKKTPAGGSRPPANGLRCRRPCAPCPNRPPPPPPGRGAPPSRYQVVTPVSMAISAMVASFVSGTANRPEACPAFSTASSRSLVVAAQPPSMMAKISGRQVAQLHVGDEGQARAGRDGSRM